MPSSLVQIIFEYAGISSKVGTFRVTVPTVYRIICQKLNSDLFNYFQSIQRLQSMKLYKLNNRNESWWDFQRSTHLSLSLNSLAASFLRYGQVEEGSNVLIATFIETIIRRIYIDAHNMLGRRSKIDVPAILMALRSSSGLSKIFRDFTLIEYLEWLNDYEGNKIPLNLFSLMISQIIEIPIDYISKLRPQSLTYGLF